MGKEWIAILNRERREGRTERHLTKSLKEVRERAMQISGGREFWADGTANAKVLRGSTPGNEISVAGAEGGRERGREERERYGGGK